jgi:hypothetical protein
MKTCHKCKETKELDLYPARGNDCKSCVASYMKLYRAANASHISNLKKKWKAKNKDRVTNNAKIYALEKPELKRAARATWRHKNSHIINALTKARRAAQMNRTPSWVDTEELWLIKQAYELALLRKKVTGFDWHVDHIVPLQGKNVSGLHTIGNLQVISALENTRKGNKYG